MKVVAVSRDASHHFTKPNQLWISLLAGLGVAGDAHSGRTVKHRSRVARDPSQPNLRQVHLLHSELLSELQAKGFVIGAGQIGENILTDGVDLLGLSTGTRLHLGAEAVVELTGLRNPCVQLDRFRKGLMAAVLDYDADGGLVRKAGVMGIVLTGGDVRAGDQIRIEAPEGPHRPLMPRLSRGGDVLCGTVSAAAESALLCGSPGQVRRKADQIAVEIANDQATHPRDPRRVLARSERRLPEAQRAGNSNSQMQVSGHHCAQKTRLS